MKTIEKVLAMIVDVVGVEVGDDTDDDDVTATVAVVVRVQEVVAVIREVEVDLVRVVAVADRGTVERIKINGIVVQARTTDAREIRAINENHITSQIVINELP